MWITLCDEISSPDYGRYPGIRPIEELIHNGLLVLDKPPGPTSRECVSWVKKILGVDKAGHSGTLDPRATGVLPIVLDRATRVMPALQGLSKRYVTVMRLHKDIDGEKLKEICRQFVGKITQKPPVRSAVRRVKRKREIYSLEVIDIVERNAVLDIRCEAGTYIRKLVHQIGEKIGGAHMVELRRTEVGPYKEEQAHTFQELKDTFEFYKNGVGSAEQKLRQILLPIEAAVEHIPKLIIKDSAVFSICNGSPLYIGGICKFEDSIKKDGLVAMITGKGELVALGISNVDWKDIKKSKVPMRGIIVRTDRVIMEPGIYPKNRK